MIVRQTFSILLLIALSVLIVGCVNNRPGFPTNDAEQTYGPIGDVTGPEGHPELVLVHATNGKEGYVSRKALYGAFGPEASSPEEALAQQNRRRGGVMKVEIPVYESDGTTQIGVFEVTR